MLERRAGSAGDRHPQGAGSASSVFQAQVPFLPCPLRPPPPPRPGPRAAESLLRTGSEGGPPGLTAIKRLTRSFSLWSQLQTCLFQLLWDTRLIREDKVLEHADTPPPRETR